MPKTGGSDMRKLIKALKDQEFTVARLDSGHYEIRREGRRVATLAGSGGGGRGFRNGIAELRRAGFVWKQR